MPKGSKKKSDDDFFEESMEFFLEQGKNLSSKCSDIVDEYNDHSLLKLIAIAYWVGIFTPICHKQLKEKFGYKVVYVDSMGGSGVTKTRRTGDCFCGSCTGAVLSANRKGFPFDKIIAVEIDSKKINALASRLRQINPNLQLSTYSNDILNVSKQIAQELASKSVSYVVIDPEGFQGMTWESIGPLLDCKGDAMITWFENDAWRMKGAALSGGLNSDKISERLTELLGSDDWKNTNDPIDLTNLFIQRVINETNKTAAECIDIEDIQGKHYKMILFAGKFRNAQTLVTEWKNHMERRLGSDKGKNIGRLLDRKAGRIADLRDFM